MRLSIEPLTVAVYEHQLYVIGRSRKDGVHPYRFSRILEAELDGSRFEYPKRTEYDPEELFATGFGIHLGDGPTEDVVVKLEPSWRTYALHHRWHRSQTVHVLPDGRVLVKIHARMSPELTAWVLAFKSEADVVSPPRLRAEVAEHVSRLAALYAEDIAAARGRRRPGVRAAKRRSSK